MDASQECLNILDWLVHQALRLGWKLGRNTKQINLFCVASPPSPWTWLDCVGGNSRITIDVIYCDGV